MTLLRCHPRHRLNEKCSGEFRCHKPVPKKIPSDFRVPATPWPTASFNLLTRILKLGIWKSANRNFKLQMEGKGTNATESRNSLRFAESPVSPAQSKPQIA